MRASSHRGDSLSKTRRQSLLLTRVSFTLLQDQLQDVLHTLSEREAGVVRLCFGLTDGMPRDLDEIGQVYGVTRERIRQIESKQCLSEPPKPFPGSAGLPRVVIPFC